MAGAEIIGLLCAGTTRFHDAGSSRCSDRLSRSELAGLLAGADRGLMAMAFAKYAGDVEAERTLFAVVRVWLVGIANAEGWSVVRGRPTISNIAALAVLDVVRPNICGRCRGVGHVNGRSCTACSGVGIRRLSGRQIAEAIGVDESRYRRVWRDRYQRCLSHVCELDSAVLSLLRHADRSPVGCHHRVQEAVL